MSDLDTYLASVKERYPELDSASQKRLAELEMRRIARETADRPKWEASRARAIEIERWQASMRPVARVEVPKASKPPRATPHVGTVAQRGAEWQEEERRQARDARARQEASIRAQAQRLAEAAAAKMARRPPSKPNGMVSHGIPVPPARAPRQEPPTLSPEARAKADAIAARVAARRRQDEAVRRIDAEAAARPAKSASVSKASDQPDPSYRHSLRGFSKDRQNVVIMTRVLYELGGTDPVLQERFFTELRSRFGWRRHTGAAFDAVLRGIQDGWGAIHRTGWYSWDPATYRVTEKGLKLIRVISSDEDED